MGQLALHIASWSVSLHIVSSIQTIASALWRSHQHDSAVELPSLSPQTAQLRRSSCKGTSTNRHLALCG